MRGIGEDRWQAGVTDVLTPAVLKEFLRLRAPRMWISVEDNVENGISRAMDNAGDGIDMPKIAVPAIPFQHLWNVVRDPPPTDGKYCANADAKMKESALAEEKHCTEKEDKRDDEEC